MLGRALIWCACILCACSKAASEGGFVAEVTVAPTLRADCISISAVQTQGGAEQSSLKVVRRAGTERYTFGVASADGLRGQVRVVAKGWLGSCAVEQSLTLNAQSSAAVYTIVPGKTSDTVSLSLSGALDDSDGDGFRNGADGGGVDCDDLHADIHPAADELCANGRDDDCDFFTDCADSPKCDGVACNDGLSCTAGDQCTAGRCAGSAASCAPPSDCHRSLGCSDDGGCQFALQDAGVSCDGGHCRADGRCVALTSEANCTDGQDDDNDQLIDCADVADCTGQPCASADLCATATTCRSDGTCRGTAKVCDTPPGDCFRADAGQCDQSTGQCRWPVRSGACDDGRACTDGDQCLPDAGCQGAVRGCVQADDGGCFAPNGVCEEPGGSCRFPARLGQRCDDTLACTHTDVCSALGSCGGTTYACAAPAQCFQPASCDGDGGCLYLRSPAGTPCDGGSCNGDGGCAPSLWPYAPSNFAVTAVPDAGAPLVVSCTLTLTTSGTPSWGPACSGSQALPPIQVLSQAAGPDVAVVTVGALSITAAGTLRLQGGRPVIFVVLGDADIAGAVRAESSQSNGTPGAGGYTVSSRSNCGTRAGADGPSSLGVAAGGGGGAFGSPGGRGGAGRVMGGEGGLELQGYAGVPLFGGCPGGSGALPASTNGQGGPGGGAVQISATGRVTVSGVMSVSGAGGTHGVSANTGGGGAGSGGVILLEGVEVLLTAAARLTANGGGGGEGGGDAQETAIDGQPGSVLTSIPADGGFGGAVLGGNGGNGATGGNDARDGEAGTQGGGGGGAGVGVVHINGHPLCTTAGALISARLSRNTCN